VKEINKEKGKQKGEPELAEKEYSTSAIFV